MTLPATLPARLSVAFALVAAVVAGAVGLLSYHAASERITDEIVRSLQAAATALADGQTAVLSAPIVDLPSGPPDSRDRRTSPSQQMTAQRIGADGTITHVGGRDIALPVDDTDRALAAVASAGEAATSEVRVGRDTYRILTTSLGGARGAVQVAVDIDKTQRVLGGMANEIALVAAVVTVVAAGLGWLLAHRISRRLVRLTGIAEEVSASGLGERTVPVQGRDEVARLSSSFNTMLRRLAESREAQERLIQDAAHELRTPLTSLRTNASVLRKLDRLSPESRERLVSDIDGETRELHHLVEELIELALARRTDEPDTTIELAEVARTTAERARRRSGRAVRVDADDTIVRGRRAGLERAVGNLLENAAKFDAAGTEPIELTIRHGTISVADRGPGLEDDDTDRVFDRFYRADTARSLPGSGLGLAIVKDLAEAHDGTAFAGNRPGGGAVIGFSIGRSRVLPDSESDDIDPLPPSATLGGT
jgi:two-component system sensor histidine kinase MprB